MYYRFNCLCSYTGVSCVILSDCCDAGLTEVLDTAIMEYVNTATTNDHLVGYQTSDSAKSSNFKHPYSVVQNFITGPFGASVAISYSCTDQADLKNEKNYWQRPSNCNILLNDHWLQHTQSEREHCTILLLFQPSLLCVWPSPACIQGHCSRHEKCKRKWNKLCFPFLILHHSLTAWCRETNLVQRLNLDLSIIISVPE